MDDDADSDNDELLEDSSKAAAPSDAESDDVPDGYHALRSGSSESNGSKTESSASPSQTTVRKVNGKNPRQGEEHPESNEASLLDAESSFGLKRKLKESNNASGRSHQTIRSFDAEGGFLDSDEVSGLSLIHI